MCLAFVLVSLSLSHSSSWHNRSHHKHPEWFSCTHSERNYVNYPNHKPLSDFVFGGERETKNVPSKCDKSESEPRERKPSPHLNHGLPNGHWSVLKHVVIATSPPGEAAMGELWNQTSAWLVDTVHKTRFFFYLPNPYETMFPDLKIPRYVSEVSDAIELCNRFFRLSPTKSVHYCGQWIVELSPHEWWPSLLYSPT